MDKIAAIAVLRLLQKEHIPYKVWITRWLCHSEVIQVEHYKVMDTIPGNRLTCSGILIHDCSNKLAENPFIIWCYFWTDISALTSVSYMTVLQYRVTVVSAVSVIVNDDELFFMFSYAIIMHLRQWLDE